MWEKVDSVRKEGGRMKSVEYDDLCPEDKAIVDKLRGELLEDEVKGGWYTKPDTIGYLSIGGGGAGGSGKEGV